MSLYTYLAYDLKSNKEVAELPLTDVDFTNRFNDSGTFTANCPLTDPKLNLQDILAGTNPARTILYVFRNTALLGGYILWARDWKHSNHYLSLNGRETWSYWDRRRITSAFTTVTFTAADIGTIASSLLNQAQAVQYGSLGMTINGVTAGQTLTVTYPTDGSKRVSDAVIELGSQAGGFDFAVDALLDSNGAPTLAWNASFPRRGVTAANTQFLFEYPGNVEDYDWPEDGLAMMTVGHGFGSGTLVSTYTLTQLMQAGYPLLEDSTAYKDITDQTHLDNITELFTESGGGPVTPSVLYVDPNQDPVYGSYRVGDTVRIRITDSRFPAIPGQPGAGLDTYLRIVLIETKPPQTSGDREIVKLTMAPDATGGLSLFRLKDSFATLSNRQDRRLRVLEST